ncbi:MAG: DUF305 domain-containing protein [Chloroflexi bacterium]|nr:DUF305 domain-containing protein [Chloroflexota bacterium]
MSEMMTHMLNMMEMTGGTGMMSEMGMMQSGMSQGDQPEMGAMADMSIEHSLHLMALLQGLTIGDLLELAGDSGEDTALMDVLDTLMAAGEFAPDMGMMLPRMGNMTHGQMMNMLGEMGNLSLADVREMAGHLDDGDDAALLSMMEHHMEVMAGGAEESTDHSAHQGAAAVEATEEAAGSSTDHAAHHPETTSEATGAAVDHSAHQGTGSGPFTDMTMTMGMMAGFDRLTGSDYVVAWLESMIDHHGDAIHMAERLLPRVVHPELGELAQRIIADQSAEIDQMEALIAELANAG